MGCGCNGMGEDTLPKDVNSVVNPDVIQTKNACSVSPISIDDFKCNWQKYTLGAGLGFGLFWLYENYLA